VPWTFEDHNDACFIVRDANGLAVAQVYYEEEKGRRTAANLMTKDEARRIAADIVKLPELMPSGEGSSRSVWRVDHSLRFSSRSW
jgi:hypothetical protein